MLLSYIRVSNAMGTKMRRVQTSEKSMPWTNELVTYLKITLATFLTCKCNASVFKANCLGSALRMNSMPHDTDH